MALKRQKRLSHTFTDFICRDTHGYDSQQTYLDYFKRLNSWEKFIRSLEELTNRNVCSVHA